MSANCLRHELLAAAFIVTLLAAGCSATREPVAEPVTPAVEPAPETVALPPAEPMPVTAVRDDAPITYVVKKGDTLWDIASRFLKDPWYWPEIWFENQQIRNPHRIYPGDVLTLHWVGGRPIVRLEPGTHVEPLPEEQKSIPAAAVAPFLIRPQVLSEEDLNKAPYVLGSRDKRLVYGAGDEIYVRGLPPGGQIGGEHFLFRPGKPLRDPKTGELLGFQVIQVADAELLRNGDPAKLLLTATTREVLEGDRLLESHVRGDELDFYPRPPAVPVEGVIIGLFDALSQVARYQAVVINRGRRDGVQRGDVLVIHEAGRELPDMRAKGEMVKLPDERVGLLMVFRVYEKVSYGLIMESERPVREGDTLRNP